MSYIVRVITIHIVHNPETESLDDLREYTIDEALDVGSVVYDRIEGLPDDADATGVPR